MGVLDEAIREHLELKRRHGAPETEVSRQEREAFGPGSVHGEEVHHEPALDEPGSFAEEVPAAPTRLHVAEPDAPEPVEEHHLHDAELELEPPRPHGDPADEFPAAAPAAEPLEPEPPVADEPPAAGQPTREFDLDEVRAASGADPEIVPADEEPEAEAEDVLEETPEFLQETPEHDRLWFEQRPPRDFDF